MKSTSHIQSASFRFGPVKQRSKTAVYLLVVGAWIIVRLLSMNCIRRKNFLKWYIPRLVTYGHTGLKTETESLFQLTVYHIHRFLSNRLRKGQVIHCENEMQRSSQPATANARVVARCLENTTCKFDVSA